MHSWFFVIPFASALIGWLINSLLIKRLFRPLKPMTFLGLTFQGILPRQQPLLAEKIGKYASTGLLSFESIEAKINDPKNLDKVMPMIEKHIDEFLRVKLGKEMPMISMFIGDKTIASMKKIFMQELVELFPQIMSNFAGNLRAEFNIEKMVKEKIAGYPANQLETIFYTQLSTEIRMIKIIGASTGFLIGLLQILLTLVIG